MKTIDIAHAFHPPSPPSSGRYPRASSVRATWLSDIARLYRATTSAETLCSSTLAWALSRSQS